MADPVVADPTPPPNRNTSDFEALPIPPLEQAFSSQELNLPNHNDNDDDNDNENGYLSFVGQNDVVVEDLDFDFTFTFDDIYLPSSDTGEFLNSNSLTDGPIQPPPGSQHLVQYGCDCFKQTVGDPELNQISRNGFSEEDARLALNSSSPDSFLLSGDRTSDVDSYLNVLSPETGEFKHECSQESGNKKSDAAARALDCPWSESETHDRDVSGPASSQSSGNCGSAVSETLNYPSPDSGNYARSSSSSPDLKNNSKSGVVDQMIRLEELGSNCLLKRKKENEDVNSEARSNKYRRSNAAESGTTEEEEKRKARLMRNRESAQLSRQRKKHYVEELEDKVKTMHSTIQDLNSKISYMMAENVTLRQQLGGGGMCPPPVPPPVVYPYPPMAPLGYPWMPYPPHVVKPQGSQMPSVPIPRLKPQQAASAPKAKKAESKKTEVKTKKVASVSFLGLLFFIVLFGGLVPMVNVKYGVTETYVRGSSYAGNRFYDRHPGMVLMVEGHLNKTDDNVGIEVSHGKFGSNKSFSGSGSIPCGRGLLGESESKREQKDHGSHPLPNPDEFVRNRNSSEPLVASLYVPRNDKLVKIDGNLIIHSVLASEKAMASHGDPGAKGVSETGLAVPGNLPTAIPVPGVGMKNGRHPHFYRNPLERQRALTSGSAGRDDLKSSAADGKLQQWFREGLAGPMLSSGMCTEVFQFDVSPASGSGAIVPATSARNISAVHRRNSTELSKKRNRRILHGVSIPLPGSSHNVSEENMHRDTGQGNLHGSKSVSSMVVSVLVDPRDGGDSNDGMMGPKSLPRIFVVVLLDSVKYVTYSCMLPFKSTGPHLVTT